MKKMSRDRKRRRKMRKLEVADIRRPHRKI
jgi:hypothetical protein